MLKSVFCALYVYVVSKKGLIHSIERPKHALCAVLGVIAGVAGCAFAYYQYRRVMVSARLALTDVWLLKVQRLHPS